MSFVINVASICPIFLVFLSVIQSITFLSSAHSALNGDGETAFSVYNNLSREEYATLFTIHGKAKICALPLYVVFVFFFSTIFKILCPILIYILSFVVSKLVFISIRNKQKKERSEDEEEDT